MHLFLLLPLFSFAPHFPDQALSPSDLSILITLPALLALLCFVLRIYDLLQEYRSHDAKHADPQSCLFVNTWLKKPKSGWVYWISQTCILVACAANVARIAQLSAEGLPISSILGSASLLAAWVRTRKNQTTHRAFPRAITF